ncbi:MAG TPA: helix-turn-helix domain-containing protein [Sporichthya sp.]|nr:helix-turn-helix domain-containing protein [Sporichthya sp.]
MLLLLALVVFLLFAGLGFFAHVLWLGLVAAVLLLCVHMWRQGLARDTPTSRLNVRLVAALRGFLDDLLTTRARERQLQQAAGGSVDAELAISELPSGLGDILDAEIVDEGDEQAAKTTAAPATGRPGIRGSVKDRAAHWRAMTPAKLARAEQLADEGATQAKIARKLRVSRSTVARHLSGKP